MKLGEYIKDYRSKNKITMQQFADDAGLSKGYVSVLEKGKRPNSDQLVIPSVETYYKVARAMHITAGELFEAIDSDYLIDVSDTPEAKEYRDSVDQLFAELSVADKLQIVLNDDPIIGDYKYSDDDLLEILKFARYVKERE